MNKLILKMLLAMPIFISCMEEPHSSTPKTISKKDLISLVKNKDARGVLFAISHQNAAKVIDTKVIQIAQEQKEDQSNLSRTGSILLMLQKHAPAAESKKEHPSSSSGKSLSLKRSHHSSMKNPKKERSPQEQLRRLIKKKDLETIEKFTQTSSVHFIDNEILDYARKKYELLCDSSDIKKDLSSSPEFLILELLKKYAPATGSGRRKSLMIKKELMKELKP
jgi:hypothetical protein